MKSLYARAARPVTTPGVMNKAEQRYALHLAGLRQAGQIVRYDFEPVKLRLADRTYYTPDFNVQHLSCRVELRVTVEA